jgi:hypothetical protein
MNIDDDLVIQGTSATPELVGADPIETPAKIYGTRQTIRGASIKVFDIPGTCHWYFSEAKLRMEV